MVPALVRTATYGATGSAVFSENTAENILFAGFVAYGGSSPYTFPSTFTDSAGNVYQQMSGGSNTISGVEATLVLYVCGSCVASASSNTVITPVMGTVASYAMAGEFEGPATVLGGSGEAPIGGTQVTLSNLLPYEIAIGMSLSVASTCEAVPGIVALYTGEPTILQYDPNSPPVIYTQNFAFSSGTDHLVFLQTVRIFVSPLVIDNFVNADGTPVANGTLVLKLNQDGSVNDTQIQSNPISLTLDSSGTVEGSPTLPSIQSINPPGAQYFRKVYDANGQLVSGPSVVGS